MSLTPSTYQNHSLHRYYSREETCLPGHCSSYRKDLTVEQSWHSSRLVALCSLSSCKVRSGKCGFVSHLVINTPLRHSDMAVACVLKGSHSSTVTPRVHPLTGWTIPAFSFRAKACPWLLTPEGWKAELAWVAGYIRYRNKCLALRIEPGHGHPLGPT